MLTLATLLVWAERLPAQTAVNERVLVVYNAHSRDSKQVAEYYTRKRSIPASNLCKIDTSSLESIKQDEFDDSVRQPIRKCLTRLGKDKVLYIVLSYQTPFGLETGPVYNAVDSFLADIWDEYLPERTATEPEVQPYFGAAQTEGNLYQPFLALADYRRTPNARAIYSVWRLDAANPELAKGLVDKALQAESKGLTGVACFDRNRGDLSGVADVGYGAGDWDIYRAAEFTRRAGFTVIEDDHEQEFGTSPAPLRCDHAALYAGWYSLNHYNDAFSWNPGAIGLHLDSASAHDPRSGTNWGANAVTHGITVTAGAITEPYLDNLPHPDQAFFDLFNGANVGDALLRSERLLKWKIINIGDPLYRPFPNSPTMAARVMPAVMLALLPQTTLGDSSSEGGVAVSRPSSQDVNFSVISDHRDLVTVPPTVTITPGSAGVKFPINTHHVSTDATTVRVRARTEGYEVSNTLVVLSLFGALNVSSGRAKGGSQLIASVTLRRPAPAKTVIMLKSSNAAVLKAPSELTVPQGQTQATFPITTEHVSTQTSAEISAAYEGLVRSATVNIVP